MSEHSNHDKDQTGGTFKTEGFFKNTAVITSISAQEGSGLVNQSPPPSFNNTKSLQDCKDEVAKKFNFLSWDDLLYDFKKGNIHVRYVTSRENEASLIYASQFRSEVKEVRDKPDFLKMGLEDWQNHFKELTDQEVWADEIQIHSRLFAAGCERIWRDYVEPSGNTGELKAESSTVSDNKVTEMPSWYTEEEMYHWLLRENYSKEIAEDLSRRWANDLQRAYERGQRSQVNTKADVFKFLLGEGTIDGIWYSDRPTGQPDQIGCYWWRKHLREALSSLSSSPIEEKKESWNVECPICGSPDNLNTYNFCIGCGNPMNQGQRYK